ncbi:hypothetical protein GS928_25235 [Rhodococcus hoagii]|nr:hypothetical protein [Prescottella equi]MBM4711107.1 hypothetical protein [Prescottella equi]NKU15251.1 hypothetical protein [Prescottella equi]NKU15289.1 hypothetical protein [Prescottella equi]NKU16058.1 hypothetical protein [Prescottella equi]
MRKTITGGAILALLLALTGCGSDSEADAGTETTTAQAPLTSMRAPTTTPAVAVASEGAPFGVLCEYDAASACMTVTISNIRWVDSCGILDQYLKNDGILAADVVADIGQNVPADFTSPFRSFPWSVRTVDRAVKRADTELCDNSALDLMQEMPGTKTAATVYFDVPANVDALVFEARNNQVKIYPVEPKA